MNHDEINQTSSPVDALAEETRYSVRAQAGGAALECFIAQRAFLSESGESTTFSEEHAHASFELLYCQSGSGMQFVRSNGHGYADRSVFLFAPFVTHAHISDASRREARYSVRFERENIQSADDAYARVVFQYLEKHGYAHFVADETMQYLMERIALVVTERPSCADLLLGGLLSALFSYVFRALYLFAGLSGASESTILLSDNASSRKFLIDFFFDHLVDGNARMDDLCRQVHLSPSQLNRVIKEIFGTTFKQKLIDVRLCYAKYFLKFSDLSVSEIAARTNFAEDSNFSLFFKQHCGMSPTEYRRVERSEIVHMQTSEPKNSGL